MGLLNKLSTKTRAVGLAGLVSAGIGLGLSPENARAQYQDQNKPEARVRVSDGADYVTGLDYREREHEWKLYKEQAKNPQKPGFGDRISNTNQDDRVFNIGGAPVEDSETRLSEKYTVEDFAKAYGIAKWNLCLSEQDKQKVKELFGRLNLEERKSLCNIYHQMGLSHDVYLTKEGKEKFEKFNQAYKYLFETKKSENPAAELFVSKDEFARELKGHYPWLDISGKKPLNVADRLLVAWYADHLERNQGRKAVDWNSVEKYAKIPVEKEF